MNKLFLATVAALFFSTSFAQFSQGSFVMGGSTNLAGSFTTSKSKTGGATTTNGKSSSFFIQPQAGYFVIDNLAVGTGLSIGTSSYKADGSSDKSSVTSFGITPLARYYFDKIYVQGSIGFGSSKTKNTFGGTTTETTQNTGSWSLLAGYAFFLSDAIALEPQLGYSSFSYKSKGSNTKTINSGIAFGIGLYAYISK